MSWIVAPSMARLMQDFRTRFPNKNREQDGTIAGPADSKSKSSHNPDDTPGSLSEYQDADNIPEVRADDIDSRFNEPGVDPFAVIAAIIRTPEDIRRLMYIIHQRTIFSRSNGWEAAHYNGEIHDKHIHFSGDPNYDNDNAPWFSVLNFGGTMTDLTPRTVEQVANADTYLWKIASMVETIDGLHANGTAVALPNELAKTLKRIENTLNNAVTAWHGLPDEEIARIAAQLARETDAATVESALRGVLSGAKVTWDSPAT